MQGNRAALFAVLVLIAIGITLAIAMSGDDSAGGPGPSGGPASSGPELPDAPVAEMTAQQTEDGAAAPPEARAAVEAPDGAPQGALAAIVGRLVGPDGAPVAGEPLRFVETPRGLDDLGISVMGRLPPGSEDDGIRASTGPDGRFRIVARPDRSGVLDLTGEGWVFAGVGGDGVRVERGEGTRDLGDLPLVSAARLAGVVRDLSGNPVAGVRVGLSRVYSDELTLPALSRRRVETDAEGRFAFGALHEAKYQLTTESPEHLPLTAAYDVTEGAERRDVVLTLQPGASIWGRIVDDLGQPIEGVTVGAYRKRDLGEGMTVRRLSDGEMAETDKDGRFHLGGVEQAAVTVTARGEGYKTVSRSNVTKGTGDLLLTMSRNGVVKGVLVDPEGQPLAGSEVRAVPQSGGGMFGHFRAPSAVTEGDGSFEIEDVEAGDVAVSATGDTHVDVSQSARIEPGHTHEVRLVAARGATVAALVLDEKGAPVEGAEVVVTEPPHQHGDGIVMRSRRIERNNDEVVYHGDGPPELGKATTDAEGRAFIRGLPAGGVVVRASHDALAPSEEKQLDLPESGATDAKLTLLPAGRVAVRVVDVDGQPVGSARVAVRGPVAPGTPGEKHNATADEDGVATLGSLRPGSYEAQYVLPPRPVRMGNASFVLGGADGGGVESTKTGFTVRAGQTAEVELVQPVLATVFGTLSDASGPVAGGTVELTPDRGEASPPTMRVLGATAGSYSAETDEDGRYRIEGAPPGKYKLSYGRKSQAVRSEQALELRGERELERHLTMQGGAIEVTVLDAEGEPLRRAVVVVGKQGQSAAPQRQERVMAFVMSPGGGGEQTMEMGLGDTTIRTDEDGIARIPDVPPGDYVVRVEHPRFITHKDDDVSVAAGRTTSIGPVQLAVGGALRGRVVGADGAPPMVANVQAKRVDGSGEPRTERAMMGDFRFGGLPPGVYEVRASPMGGQSSWGPAERVEIIGGETTEVSLKTQ